MLSEPSPQLSFILREGVLVLFLLHPRLKQGLSHVPQAGFYITENNLKLHDALSSTSHYWDYRSVPMCLAFHLVFLFCFKFYFICVSALPTCISVYHMYNSICGGQKCVLNPLGQGFQMVVNFHVDAEN